MKESFTEYYNRKVNELDEARKLLESNGYVILNEGKLSRFIAGLALGLGLITHAVARDFNAKAADMYNSNVKSTEFSQDLQKEYNMGSNVTMTSEMVQNIADMVCKKLTDKMYAVNKYELDDLVELQEWKNAVKFYKTLSKADQSLADMFSRRLDKALTKSLSIAPNIQRYAATHKV